MTPGLQRRRMWLGLAGVGLALALFVLGGLRPVARVVVGQALAADGSLFASTPDAGSSINFVAVPIGGSVSATITVSNIGSTALNVSAPQGIGAPFSVTPATSFSLAPGQAARELVVTCRLTSAGAFNTTLRYTTNDPILPTVEFTLTCTNFDGPRPIFSSTPAPGGQIDFGSVLVGSSASATITITNTGSAALNVSTPQGLTTPFSTNLTTTLSLPAGSPPQRVTLSCSPTAEGFFGATLTFTTNDPSRGTVRYSLLCVGVVPVVPVFASSPPPGSLINFGNVRVGARAGVAVAVSNSGSATLEVSAPQGPGAPFSVQPTTAFNIAAGSSIQSLNLSCAPTAAGTFDSTIQYTTNDPARPTVSYILRCTGIAAPVALQRYLPMILREPGSSATATPTSGPSPTHTATTTATAGPGTATATTTTTATAGPGTPTVTPLPTLPPPPPGAAPDLVVSLALSPDKRNFVIGEPVSITLTVTNRGDADAGPFWVDLSINPSTPPERANMIWNRFCSLRPCFGLAWYVPAGLRAGESITLISAPGRFDPLRSIWPGWFAIGTSDLYAFVDSWNDPVATGGIIEKDERNNRAELHGLRVVDQE